MKNTGKLISIRDGVALAVGLSGVLSGEMVKIISGENETTGMVCSIDKNGCDIVTFAEDSRTPAGSLVYRSNDLCVVPVGLQMFGRVVDALGNPLDDISLLENTVEGYEALNALYDGNKSYVEVRAPGIIDRQSVNEPLQTGIRAIDALIPIGRGQRELLIGDRQTGKSSVLFDIILNMRRDNSFKLDGEENTLDDLRDTVWAVYVSIGHRKGRVAQMWQDIVSFGVNPYVCLVSSFSSDPAPLQFISAYSGCAQGEYVRDVIQGHAVVFYNDLSKHAVAYRQMSLLLRRPAGREAYPGDVFYIHSRLLERSAKLSNDRNGGSLTAFPVVETQAGDITAYIPTNVISITDGQIFLESALFYKGIRPAVNIGLSVSRVGSAAQVSKMKKLAGSLKLTLAQFREVEAFTRLAVNLTNAATAGLIKRGRVLTQLFVQPERRPSSLVVQVLLLDLATRGYFDDVKLSRLSLLVESISAVCDFRELALFNDLQDIDVRVLSQVLLAWTITLVGDFESGNGARGNPLSRNNENKINANEG